MIAGGVLGIVAMRLVVGQLIALVERYPALVDGAFVIIAWVGLKLGLDYFHTIGMLALEIPHWFSIGLIVVIFIIAFIYAKAQGPVEKPHDPVTERAEELLADEQAPISQAPITK